MAMKCALIASAILLGATLCSQAYADTTPNPAAGAAKVATHKSKTAHPRTAALANDHVVTHNRDSKNPSIGWHTVNGMRQCTQDCDNPEIPGSGYTCRDVNVLGMAMRECTWSSF
jgi:hypothetical protein